MDWNKVLEEQEQDPGYKPVPANKYPVKVVKAEATKSSKGDDQLKVVVQIIGGPYDTKQIWTSITFTSDSTAGMRFALRKINALGVTREILAAQNPTTEQIASMITGAEAEAEVSISQWQGEDRNDIKAFRVVSPGASATPAAPTLTSVPPAPDIPTPTIPLEAEAAAADPESEPF